MSAVMADPAHERALKDPSGGRLCRQPPCRAGRPVRSVSSCAREGGRPKAHQTGNSLPGKKVAKHAINLSGSEFGYSQLVLLNGIEPARRSQRANRRLEEWRRKFRRLDGDSPQGIQGGFVGSPLPAK